MVDDSVLVDTNVLLAATAPHRPLHRAALTVINEWPNHGMVLATSVQVLQEYLVVATRPVEVNGLGLDCAEALANVAAIRARTRLLADGERVWERLQSLVGSHDCKGKQIYDANIVASALSSGVTKLVTANVVDFSRFAGEIEVIPLVEL